MSVEKNTVRLIWPFYSLVICHLGDFSNILVSLYNTIGHRVFQCFDTVGWAM